MIYRRSLADLTRAALVAVVDTAARVCEHALNRLDARVCRLGNDLSGEMQMSNCPAALNIEGEHFACDLSAPHSGLAHSSRAAQAIWTDDPQVLHLAWASAEASGR